MAHTLILQKWLESEAGWGIRPDGCSLHINEEDRIAYEKEYWASGTHSPQEYSRHSGDPIVIEVSQELYKQVQDTKNGLRLWKHQYSLVTETTQTIEFTIT